MDGADRTVGERVRRRIGRIGRVSMSIVTPDRLAWIAFPDPRTRSSVQPRRRDVNRSPAHQLVIRGSQWPVLGTVLRGLVRHAEELDRR
jgi:hypothetical protein